jgi:chitodextrinase
MTQYTFDLSRYGGEDGYVAIRHYHVSDMFRLNVDDIEIIYTEPAEWIYVDNLDATNYTIDGLTPETTYEVQVQAINNEGQMSNWTPSTIFTTLEAQIPQTAAPVVEHHSGVNGDHTMYVTVSESEPNCELEYRYKYNDEEWSDWMPYDGEFSFTEDGKYEIEARAKADNKEWSEVNVETGEGYDQFQITPRTAVNELNGQKAVAAVRYYNAIGQEMAQPSGMTIVVTTYSDGTTSAVKVMK